MPGESAVDGERVDVTLHDHPLNSNPGSKWQTFFKDNEVLLQIDKDVRWVFLRTTEWVGYKIWNYQM